jgi:hypothetical protein
VLSLGCSDQVAENKTADKPAMPEMTTEPSDAGDVAANSTAHDGEHMSLAKAKDLLREAEKSGGVKKWLENRLQHVAEGGQDISAGSLEWATGTFELLKKQGATTAGSVQEWAMEDYQAMGAWEYKVVPLLPTTEHEQTESELNKLGADRWECFSVVPPTEPGTPCLYYLKREKKSYLKSLPMKDLMRLVPLMGGDGR